MKTVFKSFFRFFQANSKKRTPDEVEAQRRVEETFYRVATLHWHQL